MLTPRRAAILPRTRPHRYGDLVAADTHRRLTASQTRSRWAGIWIDLALLVGFAAVTLAVANGWLLGWDLAIRDWSDGHRPTFALRLAQAGNLLGQGGPLTLICLLLALALVLRRHSVRPLLPVAAAFALTFASISLLKAAADRAAPRAYEMAHPERFGSGGVSYPSGHLANAVVWYAVLALLLTAWWGTGWFTSTRRRVVRVVPPIVLVVTTVYLSYHWLTDTVAGLLLGLLLGRWMTRVNWDRVPLGRWLSATGWAAPALVVSVGRETS